MKIYRIILLVTLIQTNNTHAFDTNWLKSNCTFTTALSLLAVAGCTYNYIRTNQQIAQLKKETPSTIITGLQELSDTFTKYKSQQEKNFETFNITLLLLKKQNNFLTLGLIAGLTFCNTLQEKQKELTNQITIQKTSNIRMERLQEGLKIVGQDIEKQFTKPIKELLTK